VALHDSVHSLAASLAVALGVDMESPVYVDPTSGGSDLLVALVRRVDSATLRSAAHGETTSRQARRRLRAHGAHCVPLAVAGDGAWEVAGPAVHLAAYPSPGRPTMSASEILSAVDHLVLQMDGTHRAVVLAPASVLCDRLRDLVADGIRDQLMRHGSVRAIVRLPAGLVVTRPRQALAMWVLGPAHGDVAVEDRWTMAADLADVALDGVAVADLVGDLAVSVADRSMVHAHTFRFLRRYLTRDLLAGRGGLVPRRPPGRAAPEPGPALAVRIGELTARLRSLAFRIDTRVPEDLVATHTTVGDAITGRLLRMVAGNRLDLDDLTGGSVRVISPSELVGGPRSRGVDRLAFSARYSAGRLTAPDDVVFCTSPRPAALVDVDGGSAVAWPARVLRVDPAAPLLPAVLAADINALPAQARTWRLWPIRRVPVTERAALIDALSAVQQERTRTLDRLATLNELTQLITTGVTAGSLTVTIDHRIVEGN
jgi:hypothetical protein